MRAEVNIGRHDAGVKPRFAEFFAYARERHAITLRRVDGKPWPWTEDPILRQYRFCSVFRELDTVTQWVDINIRKAYADHPHLWIMLAIARTINWPPTLAHLMSWHGAWPNRKNFSPANLGKALDLWKAGSHKVYTGAYMVRAESVPTVPWYSWSKQRYIAEIVIGRLWEDRDWWQNHLGTNLTLEQAWSMFQRPRYVGWGPFMAYEVVTDMRHTRYLRGAPDIMTWANPGPGAKRGLARIYGSRLVSKDELPAMADILAASQDDCYWVSPTYGVDPVRWPMWEMRDVEHTLCEFDKYERVRLGEGRPRNLYVQGRGH